MRKFMLLFLLLLPCFPAISLAHSGRTDASGGHFDKSIGEYHYHHGYSAHQHPNGICPYDYNDQTGANSGSSFGSRIAYLSSSGSGSSYDDGYNSGYDFGYDSGYDDGYAQAAATKEEEYHSLFVAAIIVPSALGIVGILRVRHKSSVRNHSLQQEKDKLQDDFHSLQQETDKLQNDFHSLQNQNTYLKNHIRSLQTDMDSLQIETQQLQENTISLLFENSCLKEQMDSLQNDSENDVDQKIIEKILSIRSRPQYSSIPVFKEFSSLSIKSDYNMRLIRAMKESMRIHNFQAGATITTESKNSYHTTLESCDCPDFQNRHHTCKHMYRLALELGLLIGTSTDEITDKLLALNAQMEKIKTEQRLLEKERMKK